MQVSYPPLSHCRGGPPCPPRASVHAPGLRARPRAFLPALGPQPAISLPPFCYPLTPHKPPQPLAFRLGLLTLWYLVYV